MAGLLTWVMLIPSAKRPPTIHQITSNRALVFVVLSGAAAFAGDEIAGELLAKAFQERPLAQGPAGGLVAAEQLTDLRAVAAIAGFVRQAKILAPSTHPPGGAISKPVVFGPRVRTPARVPGGAGERPVLGPRRQACPHGVPLDIAGRGER